MKIRSVGRRTAEARDVQRRAVTRRASRIFPLEPLLCRQETGRPGQTALEQLKATPLTSSRSPFASTAASLASTLGAKPGRAITEAPRSAKISRTAKDLTILGC